MAWRPVEKKPIEVWAKRNVRLDTKMGAAIPGPYDWRRTPWVKEIFAALIDKRIENVVWVAAAQIGKTLTLEIYVAYIIATRPQNILYFIDNETNAKWHSEHRIQPMLDAIPRLRGKVEPEEDREKLEIEFDGGVLNLAGAQSVTQLSSKSAAILIRDETSKWPVKLGEEAGALELAGERTKGQIRFKVGDFSTPVMTGDAILKQFERSDRGYIHVPCPACGHYQKLVWKQVRWAKDEKSGRSVAAAAARENTWYECDTCGAAIRERHKSWMNRNYKLVKEGQQQEIVEVDNRAAADWSIRLPGGKEKHYVLTGDLTKSRTAGFHLNRLYSPFFTWGQMAEEWLKIGEDLSCRQTFYNAALGLAWKQKSVDIEIEMLGEHVDRELPARTAPEGYEFIIAAADYHGPRYGVRFVTLGVRRDFACCVIDYGEMGNLEEFGAYTRGTFRSAGGSDGLACQFAVCDAGWETKKVVDFCAAQPRLTREIHFITPLQGAGGGAYRHLYSLANVTGGERKKGGRRTDGRREMKQLIIHPEHWKNQVLFQLTEIPWLDKSNEPPAGNIRFHRDCGSDLFEELTSEKRIERVDKRTGRKKEEWITVKKGKNHYWNALCYARAAADLYIGRFAARRKKVRRRVGRVER